MIVIVLAHALTPPEYNWRENTISELAAQGYDNKRVMQLGFIGFGLILATGSIFKIIVSKSPWFLEMPIIIYAVSVLLSGVFCTKPFMDGLDYSETASRLHSIFAQLAGISFSLALLLCGIQAQETSRKTIHFAFLAFVIICSALFASLSTNIGIIQRVVYVGSFLWIAAFYNHWTE